MKAGLLALLVALGARAEDWRPPDRDEAIVLVLGEALIVADISLTLDLKNHKGHELNPLLGRNPSDLRLTLTGGAVLAVNAIAWWYLKPAWRQALGGVVFAVEAFVVARNVSIGLCFRVPFT